MSEARFIPARLGFRIIEPSSKAGRLDITFRGQVEVIVEIEGDRHILLRSTLPYILEKIDNNALVWNQEPLLIVGFIDEQSLELAKILGIDTKK